MLGDAWLSVLESCPFTASPYTDLSCEPKPGSVRIRRGCRGGWSVVEMDLEGSTLDRFLRIYFHFQTPLTGISRQSQLACPSVVGTVDILYTPVERIERWDEAEWDAAWRDRGGWVESLQRPCCLSSASSGDTLLGAHQSLQWGCGRRGCVLTLGWLVQMAGSGQD
ncbi:hypothetical protein L204_100977 [Cryptococcus depauperatus]